MSLAYPSGEEGGILLVQMISTRLRYAEEGETGSKHPVSSLLCPVIGVLIVDFVYVFEQSCEHDATRPVKMI
jgi:hypothetical protein